MLKLKHGIGLTTLLLATTFVSANPPSDTQIIQWITNPAASNADPVRNIKIENTEEITLYSGEKAFISGVYFNNSGRNFWGGYVLTRPKLKQAKILEEFGGQANTFRVHPVYLSTQDRGIDLVEFESAGSGQGTLEASKTLTYIKDWSVKQLHEVREGSSEGRYIEALDDVDCKTGSNDYTYLNVIDYGKYVLETTVKSNTCENKNIKDYEIKTKLIPINIS